MNEPIVKALKITPQTYKIYKALPADYHHPLSVVNNSFLVIDPDLPGEWAWFDEIDFNEYYKWAEPPSLTKFTEAIKLPELD